MNTEEVAREALERWGDLPRPDGWNDGDEHHLACEVIAALAALLEPAAETEWEYGREAAFVKDGSRYDDDLKYRSRADAEADIRWSNQEESERVAAVPELADGQVRYFLVRRTIRRAGPWIPVED